MTVEANSPLVVICAMDPNGFPTRSPLFMAFLLRPELLDRLRQLSDMCQRFNLMSLTIKLDAEASIVWSFSDPSEEHEKLWTWCDVVGTAHVGKLYVHSRERTRWVGSTDIVDVHDLEGLARSCAAMLVFFAQEWTEAFGDDFESTVTEELLRRGMLPAGFDGVQQNRGLV